RPSLRGFNYRLPALQAAVLRVKLRRLEAWTEARRTLAAEYDRLLERVDVIRPAVIPGVRHVYCLYTVRTRDRDSLQRALHEAGGQTAVHYPYPIHLMPAYADARYKEGDFPVAEESSRTVLSLPLYPHLQREQIHQICEVISSYSGSRNAVARSMSPVA